MADISTHFDKRSYPDVDAAEKESCRPDFAARFGVTVEQSSYGYTTHAKTDYGNISNLEFSVSRSNDG